MLFDLDNVTYRYGDGTTALENVGFRIEAGEAVAILGANGSGKSTLLRLLSGLQLAAEGSLLYESEALTEAALKEPEFRQRFRRSVGIVFQDADAQLFNVTVFDEVAFGPRQMGMSELDVELRTRDTLEFLGISHIADRPPFRISGGEKRRVAIASVLSMNPQTLLFDEPFLALDPKGQDWLAQTLQDLQRAGKTTIVATHTLDLVPGIARRAIVLSEDHRVSLDGDVTSVLGNRNALIQANLISSARERTLV